MKIAVIGSRTITDIDLGQLLPDGVTELVSGGAKGVDQIARTYASFNQLALTEFIPDYSRYGKAAPLKRNEDIIVYSDAVLAIWDGKSRGTEFVIHYCQKHSIPITVHIISE